MITIEISMGEALDRLTILGIKRLKILDVDKAKRLVRQYADLADQVLVGSLAIEIIRLFNTLHEVNLKLWDVEAEIRTHVRADRFGELAMQVIGLNDQRSIAKRAIDELVGDDGEVKEYV